MEASDALLTPQAVTRFWSKVDQSGGPDACWPWTGFRAYNGYGRFLVCVARRKMARTPAHRVSYRLSIGPIADGLRVCHHCDNPPCCNPSHLWVGTDADNMADKVSKGRTARDDRNGSRLHPELLVRGDRHPNRVTSEDDVLAMRHERAAGARLRDLAERYGMCVANVSKITAGTAWAHVGGPLTVGRRFG